MHDDQDAAAVTEDEFLHDGHGSGPRWRPARRGERRPSRRRGLGWALVAVVLVGAVIHQVSTSAPAPRADAPPTSAPHRTEVLPTRVGIDPLVAAEAAPPGAIDSVRAIAARPARPSDIVRQDAPAGQCAIVAPGHSPTKSVLRVLRMWVGPVSLTDAQRTLDGATGLCALTIRAHLRHVVITVSIASPGSAGDKSAAMVRTGAAGSGTGFTEYAVAHTTQGWDLVVGAVGPRASLPERTRLLESALADGMTW